MDIWHFFFFLFLANKLLSKNKKNYIIEIFLNIFFGIKIEKKF